MDAADVRKVASLARLRLEDHELAESGALLTTILDYVRLLDELDLTGVEPLTHPLPAENVFRDDVCTDSLSRDSALANAPATDGLYFLVPQILEQRTES